MRPSLVRSLACAAAFGVASLAAGCGDIVYLAEPAIPHDGVYMAPHVQYALWWKLTEDCSGHRADFGSVHWYTQPGAEKIDGGEALGEASATTHRIVIAGAWVDAADVVRHEMLHAIIAMPGHPAEYFEQKCGGLVGCSWGCSVLDGAATAAATAAPIVSPKDMDVTATTNPSPPTMLEDSGWFALIVAIRNPNPYDVRVQLTGRSTFGFRGLLCNSDLTLIPPIHDQGDTLMLLRANEVRSRVFDLRVSRICFDYQTFFNTDTLPFVRVAASPLGPP